MAKVIVPPDIVASVPHSGTRTLVQHLSLKWPKQLPGNRWWHFGHHNEWLVKYKIHAHIPIRYPMDVARSWAQRNKSCDELVTCYESMFDYISGNRTYTFYRIEDLPVLEGAGEHSDEPNRSPKIDEFEAIVREHVVQPYLDFFSKVYPGID